MTMETPVMVSADMQAIPITDSNRNMMINIFIAEIVNETDVMLHTIRLIEIKNIIVYC